MSAKGSNFKEDDNDLPLKDLLFFEVPVHTYCYFIFFGLLLTFRVLNYDKRFEVPRQSFTIAYIIGRQWHIYYFYDTFLVMQLPKNKLFLPGEGQYGTVFVGTAHGIYGQDSIKVLVCKNERCIVSGNRILGQALCGRHCEPTVLPLWVHRVLNNIPRWSKWVVFVIKFNLLLPCFGLLA